MAKHTDCYGTLSRVPASSASESRAVSGGRVQGVLSSSERRVKPRRAHVRGLWTLLQWTIKAHQVANEVDSLLTATTTSPRGIAEMGPLLFSTIEVSRQAFYRTSLCAAIVNLKPIVPGRGYSISQTSASKISILIVYGIHRCTSHSYACCRSPLRPITPRNHFALHLGAEGRQDHREGI